MKERWAGRRLDQEEEPRWGIEGFLEEVPSESRGEVSWGRGSKFQAAWAVTPTVVEGYT